MKTITIEGQLRTATGKSAARQLRSQGMVPGVIYGGAQEVNFAAKSLALKPFIYTPDFQKVEMQVDGKSYTCILKDLQFDKVSDALTHIDLLELVEGKKVTATIPLKFTGAAAGVKAGGKLELRLKAVKVKCLPKDLRENIEVDLTHLELNQNIRVQDIKADNLEIMNSPRIPMASVTMTRQLKQEEAASTPAKK
jgi:large subunit ribosomal protein L25